MDAPTCKHNNQKELLLPTSNPGLYLKKRTMLKKRTILENRIIGNPGNPECNGLNVWFAARSYLTFYTETVSRPRPTDPLTEDEGGPKRKLQSGMMHGKSIDGCSTCRVQTKDKVPIATNEQHIRTEKATKKYKGHPLKKLPKTSNGTPHKYKLLIAKNIKVSSNENIKSLNVSS